MGPIVPLAQPMAAPLISQRSRRDLRGFLEVLEQRGRLRRITAPVDPDLELAAIADRVLSLGGPALLFENVIGSSMPVAVNLLGTQERVLWSMGMERAEELEALGERGCLWRPLAAPLQFTGSLWAVGGEFSGGSCATHQHAGSGSELRRGRGAD